MRFDDIKIGTTAELSHQLSENDVKRLVDLTGDDNRLHEDDFSRDVIASQKSIKMNLFLSIVKLRRFDNAY